MRTNRALIEGVGKAERGAEQRADAARGELLNREISTRKGEKMSDAENGSETVTNLSDDAAKTDAPNDRPDGQEGQQADGPDAANTAPVADSDRNRKGQFVPGNAGGPGRGNYVTASKPGEAGSAGGVRGRKRPDVDLIGMMLEAFERRGDRFFDELLKRSPVAASQLLASLSRNEPAPGTPGGEPVNIIMGDGALAGIVRSITAPQAHDLADLDAEQLQAEVQRQRIEIERLQRAASGLAPPKPEESYEPVLPAPSKEAVECFGCKHRMSIGGRMIEPHGACGFCGQLYDDSVAQRFTPLPPDLDERPTSGIATVVTVGPEAGWVGVADLSTAGVREALDGRGERGIF